MKRYIHSTETNLLEDGATLVAMTMINPKLCKNSGIDVEVEQRDEGPIPHLHVYHDQTRNPKKCSYIRLDKAAYSDHHSGPIVKLPRRVKKDFLKLMNNIWSNHPFIDAKGQVKIGTGYEAAVAAWVETYEDGDYSKFPLDDNGNLIQLDYSKL